MFFFFLRLRHGCSTVIPKSVLINTHKKENCLEVFSWAKTLLIGFSINFAWFSSSIQILSLNSRILSTSLSLLFSNSNKTFFIVSRQKIDIPLSWCGVSDIACIINFRNFFLINSKEQMKCWYFFLYSFLM